MILLSVFYPDPYPAHRAELRECLRRNARNESIEQMHVMVEAPADKSEVMEAVAAENRCKLRTHRQLGRTSFQHLFAYANARLAGQQVIIANADVYFDATLQRVRGLDLVGRLLCLSRWDVLPDGSTQFFNHPASQDAWIFVAPLRFFQCDFPMGVPACDNRLAWEAARSGLLLSNPSHSIHANHLHPTYTRNYSERDRLCGPTREVPAELLGSPWVWFVVAGGAEQALGETRASLASQPDSDFLVEATTETPGEAWNRVAGKVDDDGFVCFLPAGVTLPAGLSTQLLSRLQEGHDHVCDADGSGRISWLACRKTEFQSVGGFDPALTDPVTVLLDLHAALKRAELARVEFREEMGCSVKRLTRGTSSHNNDFRPFQAIPDALSGKAFTQVVACRVSPMSLRFLNGGKLFVLVGTDWHGYAQATEWLVARGTREPLAPVTTACGTGFEVWSLSGRTGEQLVIPTQVALVGDRLVRG